MFSLKGSTAGAFAVLSRKNWSFLGMNKLSRLAHKRGSSNLLRIFSKFPSTTLLPSYKGIPHRVKAHLQILIKNTRKKTKEVIEHCHGGVLYLSGYYSAPGLKRIKAPNMFLVSSCVVISCNIVRLERTEN